MQITSYTAIRRNVAHIARALGDEVRRDNTVDLNVYYVDLSEDNDTVFFVLEGGKKEIKEFAYIVNKRVARFLEGVQALEKTVTL